MKMGESERKEEMKCHNTKRHAEICSVTFSLLSLDNGGRSSVQKPKGHTTNQRDETEGKSCQAMNDSITETLQIKHTAHSVLRIYLKL